jgi:glycosyltransferase involved in cell wall biosynthesis
VLIAVAEWEIEHYGSRLGIPRSRFRLIPNGADLPPARPRFDHKSPPLIASIGRAERYKGHHRVIAALPHVLREIPNARLWIAGEGPYEAELLKLAAKHGVSDRVEIRCVHDRSEYAKRLSAASVATLLSDHETHPVAALEAIQVGVPTLVADNSGMTELANKGLAQSVPLLGDSLAHGRSIVELMRNPATPSPGELQISSWSECATSHLMLYEEIRDGRGVG